MNNITDILGALSIGLVVATFLLNTGRGLKAIQVCKECLILINNEVLKREKQIFSLFNMAIYKTMFMACCRISDYTNAINYGLKLLDIYRENSQTKQRRYLTLELAEIYEQQFKYEEARKLYETATNIMRETSCCKEVAYAYGKVGIMSYRLGEYGKAEKHLQKALAITIQIGDRNEEATCYENLGVVFESLGEYDKAKEYLDKALAIRIQIGDRNGEATCYGKLGTVFLSLGKYDKAKEYLEKALPITIQIGDIAGEANSYGNLGTVFKSLGEYYKAKEYLQKALAITIRIGDKEGEARDYLNLGTVFESLGKYDKAKEYLDKALAIRKKIGDRKGEASCYAVLGTVFQSLSKYDKAKEHLDKAKEYLDKALAIRTQIGDRKGEASCYVNLGTVFKSLGELDKAKEYVKKALAIRIQIGDRKGEATDYGNLGTLYASFGQYVVAEDYVKKALSITRGIGDLDKEFQLLCSLTVLKLYQDQMHEACDCLVQSMNKRESLRSFLRDNDDFKISSAEVRDFPYRNLSAFFCFSGNPSHALYVLELSRARALADLMQSQYSVERQISADPQSWIGIENIMKKESNSSCLFISCNRNVLFFWVLKTNGIINFRSITVDEKLVGAGLVGNLDDFFAKSFRGFGILTEEDCEDRSLNDIESRAALQLVEDDDEESENPEPSLSLYYRMLISPVADLLKEPELIVVPERSLNRVPFAALKDEGGKYLSETFRIRTVPSLTTLKLIQDSPGDYHSQTGALVVGDPDVGLVQFKGRPEHISRLPCARNEAVMIGRLLDVQPLLGQQATKQAVLQEIKSEGLVHFAAHGDADRGEIALSPVGSTNGIPQEEDYLLTMSDIAQVQLRAKLVVLSCCHSGHGEIKAEGVIGIARAFLGSGARSVLVALWALDDRATEQLMRRFYEHLILGESASESLHEAMKWMRGHGFDKVCDWAPFMLIGDNVTFDFAK